MTAAEEKQFEAIAQEAIAKAEQVDCSFEVFVDGLRSMMIDIRECHAMAADELRERQEKDE